MKFEVAAGDISVRDTDAIVVNLFEGVTRPGGATGAVDGALDGAITKLIADGEIKGKRGEITIIHTLGKIAPARVVVVGLGKSSDFDVEAVRSVSGETARRLRKIGVSKHLDHRARSGHRRDGRGTVGPGHRRGDGTGVV